MDRFSISKLGELSGIKPHTIRIWEQRYQALQPIRSAGNTRYYSGEQLRRLLNLAALVESGHRISDLAPLPDDALFALVSEAAIDAEAAEQPPFFVSRLIHATIDYDEPAFERIFSHAMLRLGMKECYRQVIAPLMQRTGLLWTANKMHPAEEHFLTNLIRQKLFTAIDALPQPVNKDVWLLYLPEEEYHDTGLLYAHYLIRSSGARSIYLGASLPIKALQQAIEKLQPQNVMVFRVQHQDEQEMKNYISALEHLKFNGRILAAGRSWRAVTKKDETIKFLPEPADLEKELFV